MVTNLQIKFIKSLHLKKNRQEHRQYICEGEKIVQELIQSHPNSIEVMYASDMWQPTADVRHLPLVRVSHKDLERMSHHTTVPSVIALVNFPKPEKLKIHPQPFYLYLDHIADPGNLGTIIRTADWFGHTQLFLSPNCVDIYNPKVIQSAMGSHFRVECVAIELESLLHQHTFKKVLATAMQGQGLADILDIRDSLVLMGSESHGVSNKYLDLCHEKITIPAFSETESLNVAVATGIILYHFTAKL